MFARPVGAIAERIDGLEVDEAEVLAFLLLRMGQQQCTGSGAKERSALLPSGGAK
jgi:hypothetical protein